MLKKYCNVSILLLRNGKIERKRDKDPKRGKRRVRKRKRETERISERGK